MLYCSGKLSGMTISASDGEIGRVKDLYFDDALWTVRYLVVDAGGWLENRKVLLSPIAIQAIDWEGQRVEVSLTRDQVRNSPDIDTDKPVSRQHEVELFTYYGYPEYWGGPLLWGATAYPFVNPDVPSRLEQAVPVNTGSAPADPHLRSANEVSGYHIEATDGSIGHIKDYLLEDQSWAIRYVLVDTRNWWPGKQVVIAPHWLGKVDWATRTASVTVTREAVKTAPEFDERIHPTREYEEQLHRHYSRPGYWGA